MKFLYKSLGATPCVLLSMVAILGSSAKASVTLPAIFGDHMVLQSDGKAPIWGWAAPEEKIVVAVGGVTRSTVASSAGAWRVEFNRLHPSSNPVEILVKGANEIRLQDVLIGDVWLCSGQSNMNFGMKLESSASQEIPKSSHPQIRLFMVPEWVSPKPQRDLKVVGGRSTLGRWLVCSPETVVQNGWGGFSAVSYYFGREIQAFTKRPVGLVETVFSGTPAEAWTSLEALQRVPALKADADTGARFRDGYDDALKKFNEANDTWKMAFEQWKQANPKPWADYQTALLAWQKAPIGPAPKHPMPAPGGSPDREWKTPAVLFNGMIAPLVSLGIKGVIWYQGEGNAVSAEKAIEYAALLPAMIADWRSRWGQGDFPFLIVQLAGWNPPPRSPASGNFAVTRESQMKASDSPSVYLTTAIDIGEPDDIHPKDKLDVGLRLALLARRHVYGDAIVATGPRFSEASVDNSKVRVVFSDVGRGLIVGHRPGGFHPGQPRDRATSLQGFEIAGSDGKFFPATARIENDTVVLESSDVMTPKEVRYNWADFGAGNLYNQEGLPAFPFRASLSS